MDEKKEAAIRLAIDALKSAHPTLQEIEKALDTLIAQGRQINDADKRIEANPGREQRKIQQVFSQFRASIDTIDDELLQVILDRAGITKAFSLDEKIAEAMQNSLYLVLERREKNGFGGALTGLVNSIKKALT